MTPQDTVYMNLSDDRENLVAGELTTPETIGWAFKMHQTGSNLSHLDVLGLEGCKAAVRTLKGQFFLSPEGTSAYQLRTTTRKGVKMLSIINAVSVSKVLGFEVAK